MFDLEFKEQAICLICRQRHKKSKEKETCEGVKRLLFNFLDEYRLGFPDRYNFEVTLVVRGSQIIYAGHPNKAPVKMKHKSVC